MRIDVIAYLQNSTAWRVKDSIFIIKWWVRIIGSAKCKIETDLTSAFEFQWTDALILSKMATKKAEEIQTVKLISSDKFEFIIDRKCALASGTIKNMLSSPGIK